MKRTTKETVAERLDGLMKAVPHLSTQMKLAKKTGIGQTTIGRIRRGEVNATSENLRSIADAFGVTVGYLYGEETPAGMQGEKGKGAVASPADKHPAGAGQSGMPENGNPIWPFSISRKFYDQLPKAQKDKINDFIEYTAGRWQESQQGKGGKKG